MFAHSTEELEPLPSFTAVANSKEKASELVQVVEATEAEVVHVAQATQDIAAEDEQEDKREGSPTGSTNKCAVATPSKRGGVVTPTPMMTPSIVGAHPRLTRFFFAI